MAKVQTVYKTALAIMNEKTEPSYEGRVIHIVNTLIGQCRQFSEDYETGSRSMWKPVENLNDELFGIDKTLALSVMPYGLAAMLYLDEDPARANSWWRVYQEGLDAARKSPASFEPIRDCYGVLNADPKEGAW